MGNSSSSLEILSREEVAEAVVALGPKYDAYASSLKDNGIDGALLESLNDEEIEETMDELEITSKLHRRVLRQSLLKAKKTPKAKLNRFSAASSNSKCISSSFSGFHAASKYGLDVYTPSSELEEFDAITKRLMDSSEHSSVASVSLILEDGKHPLSLKSRLRPMERLVMPHENNICSAFVIQHEGDYIVTETPPETDVGDVYVGHVLKNDAGERVGVLCHILLGKDSPADPDNQRNLMAELAKVAEEQLRLREAIVARKATLSSQVKFAKESLESRKQQPLGPPFPDLATNPEDLLHLPPDFFDVADGLGMPRPPIGKNDMERVAAVAELGLQNIQPDSEIASQLRNLVAMAGKTFRFPIASVTVENHVDMMLANYDERGLLQQEPFKSMASSIRKDADGGVFCMVKGRNISVCNYTIYLRRTFVVPDLWQDERFKLYRKFNSIRAYAGSPIIGADGHVLASLCMADFVPRHDFLPEDEKQLEDVAKILAQTIENWALWRQMEATERERRLLLRRLTFEKLEPPQGDVTMVFTDVQGSTCLWEADPSAMRDALKIHDQIIRRAISEHNGYEVKTEGDAFYVAFHDPVDAIFFALQVQVQLYNAPWSEAILSRPEAAKQDSFCGLRVRMGIHHGRMASKVHEVTHRILYSGENFKLGKCVEGMCHGGQILTTADTWRVASALSEYLGHPQVLDCGEHILVTGDSMSEGIIAKLVVQLVPDQLAFDYFGTRCGFPGSEEKSDGAEENEAYNRYGASRTGRQFPPILSNRQTSTSFHDAPHENGEATMMFIYPASGMEGLSDEGTEKTTAVLGKIVRGLLMKVDPPGYECKEDQGKWMVAFSTELPAIRFGLKLMDAIKVAPLDSSVDRDWLVRVGIHSGVFSSMGPHPITGRADYFGPVVNRAARVAAAAGDGQVCLGIPVLDSGIPDPPAVERASSKLLGVRRLKGVCVDTALFVYT